MNEYSTTDAMIFDRGHLSEVVYGNLFRNGKHFNSPELRLLNSYLQNRGIVIICDAPTSTIVERVTNTRYPKHIHETMIDDVREQFMSSVEGLDYIYVDTTKEDDINSALEKVSQYITGTPYSEMGWDKPK